MSIVDDIKKLFDKELKKVKKIAKDLSDKYEEITEEHEFLLFDFEALDNRLRTVESVLKISDDKYEINKTKDNFKDLGDFRNQIITRSKAKQMVNNNLLNHSKENEEKNFFDDVVSDEENSKKNNKKKNQRKKQAKKGKAKNKINLSKDSDNEKDNIEEFNKFIINNDKLDKTYNGVNPLIFQANDISYNNNLENSEIMSFKNKNMNINDANSVLSTSDHFSEFSFNPQKRMKNLNNKIQIQQQKINLIQNTIKDIKSIINSEIIKTFQEIELIIKSVPNYNKFDDIPEIQAIFQSSLYGDSAQNFHKFCDGEPNVVVIIETDTGNRFGGFTSIGFNSDSDIKKDHHAFLFNFDLMKVYKSKNGKKNIYCKEDFGPCFGDKDNKDLQISDNCFKNNSFVGKTNGCFSNMKQDYEINNGISNFIVNKIEIFKLLI